MIKAVIFDFGRVISAQKPMSLFRNYESELGLASGALNRVMFGSEAWQQVLVGQKTIEAYWNEIAPKLGLNGPGEIAEFRERYHADEAINAGVLELIRCLHGRYLLAVLSNSPAGLTRWLAEWGILDLFDVVICSGDVGLAKPDPAIFRLALERLGVAPQEAIFIDDSIRHVEAAGAVGLHAIHFTTAEVLEHQLARALGTEKNRGAG
jgi:putative hydrolase of the HAD superfamily